MDREQRFRLGEFKPVETREPSCKVRAWAEANHIPLDIAYCAADAVLASQRSARDGLSYWQRWGLDELYALTGPGSRVIHELAVIISPVV